MFGVNKKKNVCRFIELVGNNRFLLNFEIYIEKRQNHKEGLRRRSNGKYNARKDCREKSPTVFPLLLELKISEYACKPVAVNPTRHYKFQ